jgi:quercetin dioxygenase-like cupin family protein
MPEESVARFVDPSEVETQVFDWGSIKWLSEPRVTGTERFTAGLVILEPGKGHTRHNHPGVEEILYVVSGEGEQMIEVSDDSGGMRPERQTVRAGQMVFINAVGCGLSVPISSANRLGTGGTAFRGDGFLGERIVYAARRLCRALWGVRLLNCGTSQILRGNGRRLVSVAGPTTGLRAGRVRAGEDGPGDGYVRTDASEPRLLASAMKRECAQRGA